MDTPLVILDEPTSNLDPTVRSDVAALVADAKQAGRAELEEVAPFHLHDPPPGG